MAQCGDTIQGSRLARCMLRKPSKTYMFNHSTHSGPCDCSSTKDLRGIGGGLLRAAGEVHLQEGNLTREIGRLLFVVHVAHLVSDILKPVLATLDAGNHCR